jgi:hypothetical protein
MVENNPAGICMNICNAENNLARIRGDSGHVIKLSGVSQF